MSDAGEKIYRAEQEGEFYCTVCEEYVELETSGFDETREAILSHRDREH